MRSDSNTTPIRAKPIRSRHMLLAGSLVVVALLSGCKKEATGQVVAVVDGQEITQLDLNAELSQANLPEGKARDTMRQAALQNVINRKLMAAAAREADMDKSPEYITRKQQIEDALLVQLLSQKAARTVKQPSAAQVEKFVAENNHMFAGRTVLLIDQIRMEGMATPAQLAELAKTNTMPEVVATLNRLNAPFQRGNVQVDSASLPAGIYNQIRAVKSGEPFILPGAGMTTVNLLAGAQAAPIPAAQIGPMAANAVQKAALMTELEKQLKAARATAKITYQSGFAPPAEKAPGAAPAAK
jgi:peptidyl-prolyl cis-trans isomerase C